ncbi:5-carboxymethyl-2-hydroxymuconate isomerase [Sulfurimonas sp. SAG-AH-194-L11]|nr:5-carboxymethyl-2-hydroxymuconate isomerase [Sulfurimonas sp. SAG-AH-194-L11]MDF1878006.1 5-carboxymethyl-2-hydroxymuconate isomerase [Sulfurimonas sp. SAG-AH-194-L11]
MPHFIIHCSKDTLKLHTEDEIIGQVNLSAISTELFHKQDIKVRVIIFDRYSTGDKKENFIHVFANIMEGRTMEQKASLSKTIVKDLASLLPSVPHIGTNVVEFEKASYFNKNMLDPNYKFSMP